MVGPRATAARVVTRPGRAAGAKADAAAARESATIFESPMLQEQQQ